MRLHRVSVSKQLGAPWCRFSPHMGRACPGGPHEDFTMVKLWTKYGIRCLLEMYLNPTWALHAQSIRTKRPQCPCTNNLLGLMWARCQGIECGCITRKGFHVQIPSCIYAVIRGTTPSWVGWAGIVSEPLLPEENFS